MWSHGFLPDLKLVGATCQCSVESKHSGSDLLWRTAVISPSTFIQQEVAVQLSCYPHMMERFPLRVPCKDLEQAVLHREKNLAFVQGGGS